MTDNSIQTNQSVHNLQPQNQHGLAVPQTRKNSILKIISFFKEKGSSIILGLKTFAGRRVFFFNRHSRRIDPRAESRAPEFRQANGTVQRNARTDSTAQGSVSNLPEATFYFTLLEDIPRERRINLNLNRFCELERNRTKEKNYKIKHENVYYADRAGSEHGADDNAIVMFNDTPVASVVENQVPMAVKANEC
ncbi:hypothetical protein FIV00_03120 [Labrenzia sp. THAF82]|uniref:hypothetical protein n=1 Tax=Labrenzia sp. THAF82 TaxID=2587861 RepID=UPI0012692675|nr:hypothetical protein [Labrenzia sp. THAF82]QFT29464.1 hypothetical protein FIV00_03120 [Labrenzia sp. THAF82]